MEEAVRNQETRRPVRTLNAEVARKIAAGEVIDRPSAIIRELMDNAVDSGASSIQVEISGGGIEKIRVIDNGCGMTKADLSSCARPHATSKITNETDLLRLTTLGFRGEALSSMAAVSRLEITSGGWRMNASITEDHVLTPAPLTQGTIVQTAGLFENFPARRLFLKRPASETMLCRSMFEEKAIPRPDLALSLTVDGDEKLNLPAGQSLTERFTQTLALPESADLFYEIGAAESAWSFRVVIGEPAVYRDNRKNLYVYVNGRRIQEYSLMQAVEYGGQGYFPNGSHPVACLFVTMDPALVDFNIHPAKREARFKDIAPLHHAVSTTVRNFFKDYTVKTMLHADRSAPTDDASERLFDFDSAVSDEATQTVAAANAVPFATADDSSTAPQNDVAQKSVSYSDISRGDWRSHFFGGEAKQTNDSPHETNANDRSVNASSLPYKELPTTTEYTDDRSFRFIGSALGTFLVAEKNDTLYLIDQHAADERIRYNALMASGGQRQTLLVPYTVTTAGTSDDDYLESIRTTLESAGFSCKNCGNGKWEFYSVPIRWKGTEADLGHDLLDKRINPQEILNAIAATTACRAAVKDGTVLDTGTASRIAQEALSLSDPHCPHGRPIYTSITREQLFALVKRT